MMKVMGAAATGGKADHAPGEGTVPLKRTGSNSSQHSSKGKTKFAPVDGMQETQYDGGGDNRKRGILHRKKH